MSKSFFPIVLCLLVAFAVVNPSASSGQTVSPSLTTIKTNSGTVAGIWNNDKTVTSFKGIPFAAPPVGALRWKAPQPVTPWKGVRTCDKFSASPVQQTPKPFLCWSEEFIAPPEPLSEDCLYLNVWTPAKTSKERLPVLMWIYGGGFVSGSSACAVYDGEALAKEGIVFVSINYRVGVFGFLAHPDLTKESPHQSSGNYALMDQLAALQWIQKNIAAFGGDPQKVTIAGQSAGSFAVQALVASPLSKGLFRGAIAHSGAMMDDSSGKLSDAERVGVNLSQKINSTSIKSLRALSADSLLSLAADLPFRTFAPIVDGYVLPEDIGVAITNKRHNDVPLMAGWVTGDEALMGGKKSAEQFREWVIKNYPENKDEFLRIFPAASNDEAISSQVKLGNLQFAGYATHVWALKNSSNAYVYQYSYVPTDKPGFPNYGAFHTSEVPFALRNLNRWHRPWRDIDYQVENIVSRYWINFIKTGDPNGSGLPEWKKHDATSQHIMTLNDQPVSIPGLFQAEFALLQLLNRSK